MGLKERVTKIFNDSGLGLTEFSQRINESKPKVVHVLNGRNKPSLEFLLSVIDGFPEVDKLWLLTGEKTKIQKEIIVQEKVIEKEVEKIAPIVKKEDRKLISVIKCYSDGTFEEYQLNK